jgi:hypothetical protein
MTRDEVRKKASEGIEQDILDVLLTFGPIMPHTAKLKAAQIIAKQVEQLKAEHDEEISALWEQLYAGESL